MSTSKLFQPIRIGNITLAHRVVMSPMTRYRATAEHVPSEAALEFYSQRSKVSHQQHDTLQLTGLY